jgi:hypothetical protein
MHALLGLVVALLILFVIIRNGRNSATGNQLFGALNLGAGSFEFTPGGAFKVAARGILLQVNTASRRIWMSGVRLEQRQMRIDVEIPGREPYEISTTANFPTNLVRDLVPGAQVEMRVSGTNSSQVYIVGLGAGYAVAPPITIAKGGPPKGA